MILAFGFVAEIYQTVAVVNLYIEKAQHRETENPGGFRPNSVAYVAKVEGQQILILLAQMPELDDRFISAIDVLHRATEAVDGHVWITVHLSNLASRTGRNQIRSSSGVEQE